MGRPKAWLPFGDEFLLQRVVRLVGEVVEPVLVVAGPEQEVPSLPSDVRLIRDDRAFLGPLNGLAVGLAELAGAVEGVYLSACDVPFLEPAFVRRIVEQLGEAEVCLAEVEGHRHPLGAVYRTSVLPTARRLIAERRLKLLGLIDDHRTRILTESDFEGVDIHASTRNLNSIVDYETALADFSRKAATV